MRCTLILFFSLLFALPALGQTPVTVQNSSFKANPPAGNYNEYIPPTGWTCTGQYWGMQNPTAAQAPGLPSGTTTVWAQNGACTQDVSPVAANTNYLLTVSVGSQSGYSGAYTLSYAGCSVSGKTASGVFAPVSLPCPSSSGELVISLTSTQGQIQFTNVSLTATPTISIPPISLNLSTKLVWCTLCDGTDYSPMQGALVFQQGSTSNSFSFTADGTVTVNLSIDMSKDPVTFTVILADANGNQASGSGWTWTFARASLAAGIKTLWQLSFGGIAFTKNSDGSVSFAGFLSP